MKQKYKKKPVTKLKSIDILLPTSILKKINELNKLCSVITIDQQVINEIKILESQISDTINEKIKSKIINLTIKDRTLKQLWNYLHKVINNEHQMTIKQIQIKDKIHRIDNKIVNN